MARPPFAYQIIEMKPPPLSPLPIKKKKKEEEERRKERKKGQIHNEK